MELNHALIRVPFEQANQRFRLLHKQLTKETTQILRDVDALHQEHTSVDIDATIDALTQLAGRIKHLKRTAQQSCSEQSEALKTCLIRAQHVEKMAKSTTKEDEKQQPLHDRLVTEYLLSRGYLKSAKVMETKQGLEDLVDHDLHQECQRILSDLNGHKLESAIAWCLQNGSRLRRLQSSIEFQLRLQEFIELVRSNQKLEAIQYAQSQLTPLAMQHEEEDTKAAAIREIQEAMATLAYKIPEQCGVTSYAQLFGDDRWQQLQHSFKTAFCAVYAIPDPSSLYVALHAGLAALNTRACARTRKNVLMAKRTSKKKKKPKAEDDASDVSELSDAHQSDQEDGKDHHDEEGDRKRQKQSSRSYQKRRMSSICDGMETDDGSSSSSSTSGSPMRRKRGKPSSVKGDASSSLIPICPTCSEVGGQLSTKMPFTHHAQSRLVCRITNQVMDENNRPMVLPNGYVYSQQAIEQLKTMPQQEDADQSTRYDDAMITCVETREVFAISEIKPVYIL